MPDWIELGQQERQGRLKKPLIVLVGNKLDDTSRRQVRNHFLLLNKPYKLGFSNDHGRKKKRWALLAECEKTSFVLNLVHILSKKLTFCTC